ncbi:hypothetical protein [Lutibacter sp.]
MDPITLTLIALAGAAIAISLAEALLDAGTKALPRVRNILKEGFRKVKRAIAMGLKAVAGAQIFQSAWKMLQGTYGWFDYGFGLLLDLGREWLIDKLNLNPTRDQLRELEEKKAVYRELAL